MIIANGHISFLTAAAPAIDNRTGYPVARPATVTAEPIPCQYIPGRCLNLVRADGERVTTAGYTVLVEIQPLPSTGRVRLTDCRGRMIGEFSLQAPPEPLRAVGQTRILL